MRRFISGLAILLANALWSAPAWANDQLTVLLDWFANPDHAPLLVAQYIHAYDEVGLDVTFVPPADASMPARLVAAKHGDIAIGYQSTLYNQVAQGLPLVRVGALVDHPLDAFASLDVRTLAELKGKRVGISNSSAGIDEIILSTMLATVGLTLADVEKVDIGDQLVPPLLLHRVDVVPVVITFEGEEIRERGLVPTLFPWDAYGIPPSDQFIYLIHRDSLTDPRIPRFLAAVKKGTDYLLAHPDQCWAMFVKDHPELDNQLNKTVWYATLPYFARDPFRLDRARYDAFATFLVDHGGLKTKPVLDSYVAELSAPPS